MSEGRTTCLQGVQYPCLKSTVKVQGTQSKVAPYLTPYQSQPARSGGEYLLVLLIINSVEQKRDSQRRAQPPAIKASPVLVDIVVVLLRILYL